MDSTSYFLKIKDRYHLHLSKLAVLVPRIESNTNKSAFDLLLPHSFNEIDKIVQF